MRLFSFSMLVATYLLQMVTTLTPLSPSEPTSSNMAIHDTLPLCEPASWPGPANSSNINVVIFTDNVSRAINAIRRANPYPVPQLYHLSTIGRRAPGSQRLCIEYKISLHFSIPRSERVITIETAPAWGDWEAPVLQPQTTTHPENLETFDWSEMRLSIDGALQKVWLAQTPGIWLRGMVTRPRAAPMGQAGGKVYWKFEMRPPSSVMVGDSDGRVVRLEEGDKSGMVVQDVGGVALGFGREEGCVDADSVSSV